MGFTPTVLSAGATTISEVETNLADLQSWLNGGIVAGDIYSATDQVKREQVYPLEAYGWPVNAAHGVAQMVAATSDQDGPDFRWQRDRTILHPAMVDTATEMVPVEGLIRRIRLAVSTRVKAEAMFAARCTMSAVVGAYDGSSTPSTFPELAGEFVLCYRSSSGAVTVAENTRRNLHINGDGPGTGTTRYGGTHFIMQKWWTLAAGRWDIFVAYRTTNAASDTRQSVVESNKILLVHGAMD